MTDTLAKLEHVLQELNPTYLNIQDDSSFHTGHVGNTGGGHYSVTIVSEKFNGLSLIKRHRLIYSAAKLLMNNEIHALSIHAKTSTEKIT